MRLCQYDPLADCDCGAVCKRMVEDGYSIEQATALEYHWASDDALPIEPPDPPAIPLPYLEKDV